jgi:hypothetical protein
LPYILNFIRRCSLLTWPKPHSYKKLSVLRTGLLTAVETQIDAGKNTCETYDKN